MDSLGAVTLSNITAAGNSQYGVYVDNCDFDLATGVCGVTPSAGVTVKGANTFIGNGYDGLRVWSGGAISVSNITAENNGSASRPIAS